MSTFILKIIATVTMLIDHIGAFFPNTPIIFRWIGRISAPIFVFCTVNGMVYTKSPKKFLLRLYIANVGMSIIQMILNIQNNFFRTLFCISLIIYILQICKGNRRKSVIYLLGFVLYQIAVFVLFYNIVINSSPNIQKYIEYFLLALLGSTVTEGGVFFILIGVFFYLCLNNPIKLSISYITLIIINTILCATTILSKIIYDITSFVYSLTHVYIYDYLDLSCRFLGYFPSYAGGNLLTEQYQWMMVFTLPFILLYNKEKGKSFKYFFYIFYPLHIIILYCISQLLAN